ncbi:hypothetical protein M422DRAFT_227191 [Sphaerobolus stellatus SS14]|uniref:3'-5' exonuclease domain-containing protein n=1 Tax=Sphaerobolus stellatus (strain SS14) TaxID=990650 RepID=A0A0C9VSS4_SPHS4|nr:hypothetical protein M422DRAFT_227191 [Sphaerobolus stellatus SS14]
MSSRRPFSRVTPTSSAHIPRSHSQHSPYPLPRFSSTHLRPSSTPNPARPVPSGQALHYLRDHVATDHLVNSHKHQLKGPLGFDIEYPPTFVKGQPQNKTALVQLASDSIILLVQVSAMSVFPPSIKAILEDPDVVKVGVGILADFVKLRADFGINPASCLELGILARAVDPRWEVTQPKGLIGLARLVKTYLDRVMPKPKRIQLSNWSRPLTEAQQDYAANDVVTALAVHKKISLMLDDLDEPPSKDTYIF